MLKRPSNGICLRAQRRKLPDERKSVTHKFSVGGHEGYIIVGQYEEGTPGEIFIKMAKEGSTLSGFMDGVAVSISISLQYGVPLRVLVDKLTNTRFEPSGFTENPSIRYASSILAYLARWLGGKFISPEYLKPRAASGDHELIQPRQMCQLRRDKRLLIATECPERHRRSPISDEQVCGYRRQIVIGYM